MAIVNKNAVGVRCSCIVDLISRRQRPYLFRVVVTGEYPHAVKRTYDIGAVTDDSAAHQGLQRFEKEMASPLSILGTMV